MSIVKEIRDCIETQLNNQRTKFIIFPFGDVGMQVKKILKEAYGIDAVYIVDNELCKYNSKVKS